MRACTSLPAATVVMCSYARRSHPCTPFHNYTSHDVHNFVRACLHSRARTPRVHIPRSGAGLHVRGQHLHARGDEFTAILITRLSSAGKHKFRSAVLARTRAHFFRGSISIRGYSLARKRRVVVAQPPVNFTRLGSRLLKSSLIGGSNWKQRPYASSTVLAF